MPHVRGALRTLVILLVAGCGGSSTNVEDPVPTTLTLSPSSVELTWVGQGRAVSATLLDQFGAPLQADVAWVSEDVTVATVSTAGVIRAVGNGTTVVEASTGGLSETVEVSVEQVPTFLAVAGGNEQNGIAATTLPDPLVVRVQDQGGQPVPDVQVTFTPDPNSGSVDPAAGVSGPDGQVSTTWTLGPGFGRQRVVASIDVSEAELGAFAGSETPTPDLLLPDGVTVTRSDPTTFDTVAVRGLIRNRGDGEALSFRVQLLVDGVELASREVGALAPGEEQIVELADIGPLDAGERAVELVVDPDGAVLELDESNNVGSRQLVVLEQRSVEPGVPVPGLAADAEESLLFRVDVAGPTNLTVDLSGGSGDVDLSVEGGRRPSLRTSYDDCISDGPTMEETCQLPGADGTYHILVHGAATSASGFSNATLTVTLGDPVEPFDLELVLIDNGSASQDQAFLDAADTWGSIIFGDVPDFDLGGESIPANQCIDGMPSVSGTIDDVIIYAAIRTIDGPSGTLARAGPCYLRHGSGLPFIGFMEFDKADLDRLELDGDMEAVVLHEMGHVLGIGTIWRRQGFLQAPSTGFTDGGCTVVAPDADTHFTGELARLAFDAAGGGGYAGSKVPVANGELGAGCGSADGHWRESVMQNELMTPFLNSLSANPLSAVTIQSLADLGYAVDLSMAEPYALSLATAQAAAPAPVDAGPGSGLVDLGGDLYLGPVWVMEQGGRVVRILR